MPFCTCTLVPWIYRLSVAIKHCNSKLLDKFMEVGVKDYTLEHNCLTLQRYTYSPCNYLPGELADENSSNTSCMNWKCLLKYLSSIDTYTQLSVTTNLFTLKHSFIWKESSCTSELMSIRVVLPSIKDKVCSKLSSNPHAPNPLQLTHCTPSICVVFDGKPELPQWRLLL